MTAAGVRRLPGASLVRAASAAAGLAWLPAASAAAALSWAPEANLSQTATDSETGLNHHPMALAADGTLHVVWAEQDAPNLNYRIHTRRLAAGAWSGPQVIVDYLSTDPGSTGGAKYPALLALPDGSLDLFWHDYRVDGIANIELFTKTRPAGGAWDPSRSADTRLTTTNHPETLGDNGYVPVPAAAADGTTHVVWFDYRHDGQFAEIFAKTRPAGGVWDVTPGDSADVRLSNDPQNSELPDADTDTSGHVHAAWRSGAAGARISYARRDAVSGAWSAPVDIDLGSAVAGAPALAVDLADRVHVVWPDARDGGKALWTRTRDAAGSWGSELRLTPAAEGADEPSLDLAEDGSLHLVWHDGRVSLLSPQVFHRSLASGAVWDTTAAGDTRVSAGAGPAVRPSVLAENGLVYVLWKDARAGANDIYLRIGGPAGTSAPGAASGTPLAVAPNPTTGPVRFSRGGRAVGALEIWDVRGRRVRRLPAGGAETIWDLRRDDGTHVPPGQYFLRAAGAPARRVTVLR